MRFKLSHAVSACSPPLLRLLCMRFDLHLTQRSARPYDDLAFYSSSYEIEGVYRHLAIRPEADRFVADAHLGPC